MAPERGWASIAPHSDLYKGKNIMEKRNTKDGILECPRCNTSTYFHDCWWCGAELYPEVKLEDCKHPIVVNRKCCYCNETVGKNDFA